MKMLNNKMSIQEFNTKLSSISDGDSLLTALRKVAQVADANLLASLGDPWVPWDQECEA